MKIFHGVLAMLCASSAFCQSTTSISYITQESINDIGSTAKLSCVVTYPKDYAVSWLKVNKINKNVAVVLSIGKSIYAEDSRFVLRKDVASKRGNNQNYTLLINDVKKTDAGLYQCQVLVELKQILSADVQLEVRQPPIILKNSSVSLTVRENESVRLECYADGVPIPKVSWEHLSSNKVYGNVFDFPAIKKEDGGIYSCVAENGVGRNGLLNIYVLVTFVPIVTAPTSRLGQALHFGIQFECKVKAFPPPIIIWLKNGLQLPNNTISYMNIDYDTIYSSIFLNITELHQYGDYICKASNSMGTDEATVNIYETKEPQTLLPLYNQNNK